MGVTEALMKDPNWKKYDQVMNASEHIWKVGENYVAFFNSGTSFKTSADFESLYNQMERKHPGDYYLTRIGQNLTFSRSESDVGFERKKEKIV